MTYEENQYLIHYGVKGQKYGVRRFQNEDGTLTAEGKQRYAGMTNYGANPSKGLIRRQAEKAHGTTRAFAEWREGRHAKNLAKVNAKYDKKINKQKQALKDIDAQAKKNPKEAAQIKDILNEAKRGTKEKISKLEAKKSKKAEKYRSKKEAQSAANSDLKAYRDHSSTGKLLLRSAGYEHARARGSSRGRAFIEGYGGLVGLGLRMAGDKKKYGKKIVYGDVDSENYNALAMDKD